nr:MAG TPA: hypothetical protein [Caudoviricetes sp.]
MQHTKNFNLNKPEGTDYADIEKLMAEAKAYFNTEREN